MAMSGGGLSGLASLMLCSIYLAEFFVGFTLSKCAYLVMIDANTYTQINMTDRWSDSIREKQHGSFEIDFILLVMKLFQIQNLSNPFKTFSKSD